MSSRRSDQLPNPVASGWRTTLLSNAPLPVLIALLIPIGWALGSRAFGHYNERIVMLIGFNIILAVSLQLINGFSGQFSLGHAGFMAVGAYLAAYPAMTYSHQFHEPGVTLLFFVSLGITIGIAGGVLGGLFVLLRRTRRLHRSLPGILLLILLVWILADFAVVSRGSPSPLAIWTRGLGALESLFSAILTGGASPAARLSSVLPAGIRQPLCFIILLGGGGACAAAVGFIVGLPALRLRGDYLAIATLGFAEIIRIAIQNSPPLGGALGLTPIPKYTSFPWLYGCVIVTVVVIWRIAYSPKGRAIMAVREDEIAAAAIGLNTTQYKVTSFIIGAFFAGVAGALYALYEHSITPTSFGLQKSIEIVVMVTLGGLGSISGAILAAAVLTLLPEVLRPVAEYRMVIYSLLLVIMMLLRPQGLLGGWELWPAQRGHVRPPAPTADEPVPA
jgi:ABC-type branched-subunit amino acid transport system permease subunit